MRFRGKGEARTPASGRPGWRRRFRLTRTRRLVLVAGATVALTGTAAGMTAAAVTAGGSGHREAAARTAHAGPAARAAGSGARSAGTTDAGATGAGGARSGQRGGTDARHARSAAAKTHGQARAGQDSKARAGHGAPQRASHAAARQKALRTSCRSVAHVGDSTSVDLISPDYLPDPAQRIGARYADVGVRHLKIDASGGRSIVEELPGQLNGYKVASAWRGQGFRGCWVFALGTNDAANVAAGSTISMMARIDEMMAVAHGQPVLWVNTKTLLPAGPYASANERAWDATLLKALAKYPNMRIFNWSAIAQPGWFLSDGVHYNSLGCAIRAKAIADALARAFPLHGHGTSRIVR
jgi:hypothetical protein